MPICVKITVNIIIPALGIPAVPIEAIVAVTTIVNISLIPRSMP